MANHARPLKTLLIHHHQSAVYEWYDIHFTAQDTVQALVRTRQSGRWKRLREISYPLVSVPISPSLADMLAAALLAATDIVAGNTENYRIFHIPQKG